jgi:hypothetical protein
MMIFYQQVTEGQLIKKEHGKERLFAACSMEGARGNYGKEPSP